MGADTYTVVRSASIDAPPAAVYERIVDFRRWREWSPWEDVDPALQRTYTGPDSGVGASYAWAGNRKAGHGRMEITEAQAPGLVALDLHFLKPFKADNALTFAIEPEGSGSRITWTMKGAKTFAVKVMGLFSSMDKVIGKDFEKGLAQLKAAAEGSTAA